MLKLPVYVTKYKQVADICVYANKNPCTMNVCQNINFNTQYKMSEVYS